MELTETRARALRQRCLQHRRTLLDVLYRRQTGHPGGSLSVCEILTVLYGECANISPENQEDADRDRIVLTKGHAAPMQYILLAEKGFFPREELFELRKLHGRLQGHPSATKTPGVELSTGPLGIGLSACVGMACVLGARRSPANVFAVMGDGELNEGTVWEAAMAAAKFRTGNLVAIVDRNRVQLDGPSDAVMPLGDLEGKWRSFGWHVIGCDGHDVSALYRAIEAAKAHRNGPAVVIADTVKGKGVDFMEGECAYHGKAISEDEYRRAAAQLGGDA